MTTKPTKLIKIPFEPSVHYTLTNKRYSVVKKNNERMAIVSSLIKIPEEAIDQYQVKIIDIKDSDLALVLGGI
jgi:hypothetical protein